MYRLKLWQKKGSERLNIKALEISEYCGEINGNITKYKSLGMNVLRQKLRVPLIDEI